MRNHHKSNAVRKEEPENQAPQLATIIPWPETDKSSEKKESKSKWVTLDQKFLYYKGQKIPILQFQKAGYEKLLKLLVKEIRS
jgi:hypothetical protein